MRARVRITFKKRKFVPSTRYSPFNHDGNTVQTLIHFTCWSLVRFPSFRPCINVALFRPFVRDVNREFGFSLRTFRDYSRGGFLCSVDMHLPSDRQAGFLKGDPMTVIRYLTDTGRRVGYGTRVSVGDGPRHFWNIYQYVSETDYNRSPLSSTRRLFSRLANTSFQASSKRFYRNACPPFREIEIATMIYNFWENCIPSQRVNFLNPIAPMLQLRYNAYNRSVVAFSFGRKLAKNRPGHGDGICKFVTQGLPHVTLDEL